MATTGEGLAPKYGDYEAQRHWMELTTNLPPSQWCAPVCQQQQPAAGSAISASAWPARASASGVHPHPHHPPIAGPPQHTHPHPHPTPPRYVNGTDNDLSYWGLDYPPLTAYQSWAHGAAVARLDPATTALHASRGHESPRSKLLLRLTVLSSDLLLLFPAAAAFVWAYYARYGTGAKCWALACVLLQPAALLIDHGHFQYNTISLGLTVRALRGCG